MGDDGNEVSALEVVHVDVVFYSVVVRGPDGRAERLVLRRTVFIELDDDTEAWVEELWISDVHRSLRSTARAVQTIGTVGTHLVLGKPLTAVPGMEPPTSTTMPELAAVASNPGGRVDLLIVLRGHVRNLTGERRLTSAEVSSAATFVGRVRGSWSSARSQPYSSARTALVRPRKPGRNRPCRPLPSHGRH